MRCPSREDSRRGPSCAPKLVATLRLQLMSSASSWTSGRQQKSPRLKAASKAPTSSDDLLPKGLISRNCGSNLLPRFDSLSSRPDSPPKTACRPHFLAEALMCALRLAESRGPGSLRFRKPGIAEESPRRSPVRRVQKLKSPLNIFCCGDYHESVSPFAP